MQEKRIGYAQFLPDFGRRETNLDHLRRLTADAGPADLLVFPELAVTGYEFRDAQEALSLAEPFETGPTSQTLLDLAATHAMTLVTGYAERSGSRVYNACMLATPQRRLHNYRKIHLFSREKDLFSPGDAPPPVIDTPAGRIGLMICFDWIFPETARLLALGGAHVIAHPANLVLPYCQRAMVTRSIENKVFTVTANRIGEENRAGRVLRFTGASQVLNPRGEVLARASADEEAVATALVDLALAEDKSVADSNDLMRDRRIDLYDGLLAGD